MRFKKYGLLFFLFIQVIFIQIIKHFPENIEKYYSNWMYPKISFVSSFLTNYIRFSVGDCLYFIIIMYFFLKIYKTRNSWKLNWKANILSILNTFSIFYFLFHFLWGYNYYRVALSQKLNLKTEYSDQDLVFFTEKLINKTNQIQLAITHNAKTKVVNSVWVKYGFKLNENGYQNLAKNYPMFAYSQNNVKTSLFSKPLSNMGFGGYLNPFTNEAQVNIEIPKYSLPLTANHEMAHQIGFASESECNFVGYLASVYNDNIFVQYAGYSFALRYCMAVLEKQNPKKAKEFWSKINYGIKLNFRESKLFWQSHQTVVEDGFKVFYDNFLKINQQKDGLAGYGKFLNLLINFDKQQQKKATLVDKVALLFKN